MYPGKFGFCKSVCIVLLVLVGCGGNPRISADKDSGANAALPEGSDREPEIVISPLGDTVVTGLNTRIKGTILGTDTFLLAHSVPFPEPEVLNLRSGISEYHRPMLHSEYFQGRAIDSSTAGKHREYVALNSVGDTLLSGMPVPAKERPAQVAVPRIIPAGKPRFRPESSLDIQNLSVEQGLVSDYLRCLMQDSRGHLWIGTLRDGLVRYDGEVFMNYSLGADHFIEVTCMMEDSRGNLWFGSSKGLFRYDGVNVFVMDESSGLPQDQVVSMMEDSHGLLWFGTYRGLTRYDGSSFIHFTVREGLSQEHVWCIQEDRQGDLWLGTSEGLNHMELNGDRTMGSFRNYQLFDAEKGNSIRSLALDPDGHLWVGGWGGGLCHFIPPASNMNGLARHFLEGQELRRNIIMSLKMDHEGTLWVGSDGGGMCSIMEEPGGDGFEIRHFGDSEGLTRMLVYDLILDQKGDIWAATSGGGLCCYSPGSYEFLGKIQGLKEDNIYGIHEDRHGKLWIGTMGKGLYRLEEEKLLYFSRETGFLTNNIYTFLEDRSDRLWIGTFMDGVLVYDNPPSGKGGTVTQYTMRNGLPGSSILSLEEDLHGNIWIGTRINGLAVFNGQELIRYALPEGLPDVEITDIHCDRMGNIWLGMGNSGLVKLQTDSLATEATITVYSETEGLSDNTVECIYEDAAGHLWLGTEQGGVNYLASPEDPLPLFRHLGVKEGLSNNCVWSIHSDSAENLWIATENGLNILPGGGWESIAQLQQQGILEGMHETEFLHGSVCLDRNNHIWWGAGEGVVHRDLGQYEYDSPSSGVNLLSVKINNHPVDYHHLPEMLRDQISFEEPAPFSNIPGNLVVPFRMNKLAFRFNNDEGISPNDVKYSYRIRNLGEEWSQPQSLHTAEYHNLPIGNHLFEVRARQQNREWSKATTFAFKVLPPWYLSWGARIMYIISLGVLIYLVVRYRTSQLRAQKLSLKENVHAATSEILEQKVLIEQQTKVLVVAIDKLKATQQHLIQSEKMASLGVLTAGVAHEINNPLNFIQTGIYGLNALKQKPENFSEDECIKAREGIFEGIQDGVDRITSIVSSLKHFSRTEDQMDQSCYLHQILQNCLVILNHKSEGMVDIRTEFEENDIMLLGNDGRLHQAFINIIDNAIQSVKGGGEVLIRTLLQTDSEQVLVSVTDTGVGIEAKNLSKIFEPFYTTKEPGEGTGLGLSIVYTIIQDHMGSIEVDSQPGKGSEFRIFLPLPPLTGK